MQHNSSLAGARVLVTGAARRIGAAIVTRLHAAGAAVGIHYRRSADDARALCERLNAARDDSAQTFRADLCDLQQTLRLLESFRDWQGGLDVLVNNASSFYPTPVGDITDADWRELVGSNLKAPLFLSQAAAPSLRETRGAIINLVDIHARRPLAGHVLYSTAKAGLVMLTQALARELAPDIRVNGIAPGAILWPEDGLDEAARASILARIPLGKSGEPDDIAECVLYLLRAGYVTGQIIAVDGGRSIGW